MDNKRVDLRIIWNSSKMQTEHILLLILTPPTYFIINSDISQFEWEKKLICIFDSINGSYAN